MSFSTAPESGGLALPSGHLPGPPPAPLYSKPVQHPRNTEHGPNPRPVLRRPRLSSRSSATVVLVLLLLVLLAGYHFLVRRDDLPPPAATAAEASTAPPVLTDSPQVRRAPLEGVKAESEAPEPAHPVRTARTGRTPERAAPGRPPSPRRETRVVGGREFFAEEPAVLLTLPAAGYPAAARGTGTWAEVVVAVVIDEKGAVRSPAVETSRIRGSAPESAFHEAALAAARQARYAPARERGVPVRSRSTLTFTFETAGT